MATPTESKETKQITRRRRMSGLRPAPLLGALLLGAVPATGWAKEKSPSKPAAQAAPTVPEAPIDPKAPLSLPDAVALALITSPRLEAARGSTAGARAQKRGAKAEALPQVGIGGTGTLQGPSVTFPGGGALTPARIVQGTADFSVPLYTGGRIKAGKRAASAAERAALLREDAEAQNLVLDVTQAYLGVLEARQQAELLAVLRKLDEERLRVSRVRLTAGIAVPLEVSQAEADLAETTQQEIEAQARLKQTGATLNTLLARPAETPLNLIDPDAGSGTTLVAQAAEKPLSAEEARTLSQGRPDVRALREDVQQAEAGVDTARAARRPFASLSGNLLRRLPETLAGGFAWSLVGSIAQTIFDGGRSRAQVEAARADRDIRGANLKEAERLAQEQVEQARVALEAADQRLAAEDRRIAAAEQSLSVAQQRNAAGITPRLEVTEAEAVLARARTARIASHFNVARSRTQLAYALGQASPARTQQQVVNNGK